MQIQPVVKPADIEFDLSITRTLVPLKQMSESHLLALLEHAITEVVCVGQPLFGAGSYDAQHVYLLHGTVSLEAAGGTRTQVKGRETFFPLAQCQPRQVTAIAETDCSVLRIDSEILDKMLTWSQVADYLQLNISRQRDLDEDIDWMMTVLRSNLFFKVPPLNVEQIFSRLTPQVVYAGEVIIRQGEIGDQCYFIKEGEAEVFRHLENKRQHLATIGVGRCFGEDALVNETVRNATVQMYTDGVVMRLDKQDFYRLLKEPKVATLALDELKPALSNGAVCVDVRSDEEYNEAHLAQAVNVPLDILALKARLINKDRLAIFYCDTGRRSRAAAYLLAQQGYQALALADCTGLFAQAGQGWLDDVHNYVLREGVAVRGD